MSGDGTGDFDADDWFSRQFNPPPEEKKPAEEKPVEPPAAEPVPAEPVPAEPPALDPSLWGAPPAAPEPPTVALPWESAPEPVVPAAPTELLGASRSDAGSPLDSLFGEQAFKEYEGGAVLATGPLEGGTAAARPRQKGDPLPPGQRTAFWIAGVLVGILALVALFFLGTKLPGILGPSPAVVVSPTITPTPTKAPVGPVAVGVHKWSDLRGGECLSPFTSVWAETFTVVDCATPHPAQMVYRGTFPPTPAAPSTATPAPTATPDANGYPGIPALQAQINLLCTAPGVIDLSAAGAYSDVQLQAAYAASAKEWDAGEHDYYCFVTRSSGQPFTNSVAVAPAAG